MTSSNEASPSTPRLTLTDDDIVVERNVVQRAGPAPAVHDAVTSPAAGREEPATDADG